MQVILLRANPLDAITRTANTMTDPHELKGNEEQCRALYNAVTTRRVILDSLKGFSVHVDNFLSEEDAALIWWQQQLKSKGLD